MAGCNRHAPATDNAGCAVAKQADVGADLGYRNRTVPQKKNHLNALKSTGGFGIVTGTGAAGAGLASFLSLAMTTKEI